MTTLAEAVAQMIVTVTQLASLKDELGDWASGTVNGGPNSNGLYPFTQPDGAVILVPSPPKISAQITGKYTAQFDAATATATDVKARIAASDVSVNQIKAWLSGAPHGGPFGTGLYPITLSTGTTVNIPSPARMKADQASIASIIGSGSLIALVDDRTYAAYATLAATTADEGKWALVHSDVDVGRNGYWQRAGGAWVMRVSLASEALLIALGDKMHGPAVTQLIGRQVEPSRVGNAVTGSNLFLWNAQVAAEGTLTGVRIFAANTGTLRVQTYSVAGTTATKKQAISVDVPKTGYQTLYMSVPVAAGDYVGISGANIFTSSPLAADDAGWYQFHADPDTRPLGVVNTTTRLEVQFQLSTIQQTVNAQAFGEVVAHVADLIASTATLEAEAALMWRPVTQVIGLPAGEIVQSGVGASDQMFIWADPVARDGIVTNLRFFAVGTGTLQIARYSRNGNLVAREAMLDIPVTTTGAQSVNPNLPILAGEYIGICGAGIFTSRIEPADGAGWWQVIASVPVRTVGTPVTNIRLFASFAVSQPIQFVTAERVATIETQGADHEARLQYLEPCVAALNAAVVQTVGRREPPIDGTAVAASMFIFNAPIAYDGSLSLVTIFIKAAGTFTLVRWSRNNTIVTRRDVRTIVAPATGVQSFTPADFGGEMLFKAGDYIGLAGVGLWPSSPGATDDDGWWQVVNGIDVRTLSTLYTTNRLEAQFRIDQFPQIVTAESYAALKQEVDELKSSGVGADLPGGALLKATNWFNNAEAEAHKAPLMGGRAGQRITRSVGKRTLAHLAKVADVQGGASISAISDETTTDTIYSTTALKMVTTPLAQVNLAPTVANTVPTNVVGGMIRWMFKPLANVYNAIDRFSIELHSAGTPAAPSANFHTLAITVAPSDLRRRLTSQNGTGRWQGYSVAVSQFTAQGAGANLSAVLFAILRFRTKSGESATLHVGNIEYVPSKLTKGKCIFSFDDGRLPQITYVAGMLAKYGFPAVLFPSPVAMSTDVSTAYITSQQIRNLHDHLGWQIGSQAWSTEDRTIVDGWSENQFTSELSKLRTWHNAMGLTGGEHGSYFSGVSQLDMIAAPTFRKHFRSMRAYYGGAATGTPFYYGETFPYGDPMAICTYAPETLDTSANGTQCIAHAQQAATHKLIAYYGYHDPTMSPNFKTGFEQLLAWLDANRDIIDVVTEDDVENGK